MVEGGVELSSVLTARKLLIPGTATTAKKASLPDPLYVYCTRMLPLSSPADHIAPTISRRFVGMGREKAAQLPGLRMLTAFPFLRGRQLPLLFFDAYNLRRHPKSGSRVYLIGREPVMRMSTSLLALCCQSGPDATWETPINARSRSNGSRSLRISPLLIARFTNESTAP
jgi:hypothetical protein